MRPDLENKLVSGMLGAIAAFSLIIAANFINPPSIPLHVEDHTFPPAVRVVMLAKLEELKSEDDLALSSQGK